jgi:DNA-binding beta-propeller fold protein YncE
MRRHVLTGAVSVAVAAGAFLGGADFARIAVAQDQKSGGNPVLPIFEVDPHFPTMPDHKLLGGVGGATADSRGNVWVFHRPHTLEEGNATENGYVPAPPVLQFSATGQYILGWGGPTKDGQYDWFNRGGLHSAFAECASCTAQRRLNGDGRPGSGEHGIAVDTSDNVWLTGNGDGDGQILKFTKEGKFLLQIGKGGVTADSNNTEHLSRPAAIAVYAKTNEVFVADGYGNRRVIVFDAESGAYKRYWGAYGNKPDDKVSRARQATGPGPQQFNTPHGITVSNDGVVYVSDRANNRVQAFRLDGAFLKEGFVKRESKGTGTAFGVALSADPEQRFVYVADGSNERIAILDRTSLEEIGHIGGPGRKAGEFFHLHSLGVDPSGNLVTGESQGYRVQKFIYKGVSAAATR